MTNFAVWFEIPVSDIERAAKFYSTVFEQELEINDYEGRRFATFTLGREGVGGSLNQCEGFDPGDKGPLIYLTAGDDLTPAMNRVEAAGGKLLTPKTDLGGGFGFYAMFNDTEGNTLALHSSN
ncbi:MAG: VOC family protein [Chloroflexi bacterium]|nr:VOC family protein [Chloroflexota bacterium]